jgi:hypothetical protein
VNFPERVEWAGCILKIYLNSNGYKFSIFVAALFNGKEFFEISGRC